MFAARAVVMLLGMAAIAYYMQTVSSAVSLGAPHAPRQDTASCKEMRADYNNARLAERNGYSYSSGGYDHSASDALAAKMSDANCSLYDPSPDPNQVAAYDSSSSTRPGEPSLHLH